MYFYPTKIYEKFPMQFFLMLQDNGELLFSLTDTVKS